MTTHNSCPNVARSSCRRESCAARLRCISAQAQAKGTFPPGTTFSTTPLSGVGDQAVYGIVSGSFKGVTGFYAALDTTVGSVAIGCADFGLGSPGMPQQPALTQVCTQVVSRV